MAEPKPSRCGWCGAVDTENIRQLYCMDLGGVWAVHCRCCGTDQVVSYDGCLVGFALLERAFAVLRREDVLHLDSAP